MQISELTSVLFVPAIEPVLAFWEPLGFALGVHVAQGESLGFAILEGHGLRLMYQTYASLAEDAPQVLAVAQASRSFSYLKVDALDPLIARLGDAPVYLPRRTTFYGADEIGVTDPAGHYFTFACFAPATAD